jgi:hypothetical protein
MIYSATVLRQGTDTGTWIVTPLYTREDGQPAPDILALAADSIVPLVGDIVLCAEGINPFDHSSVRSFDNNYGSNPIIVATFEQLFTTLCDMVVKGKMTLGAGTEKMVLGTALATWARSVDLALSTLSAAVGNVLPAITASVWSAANLSANHKLD